MKYCIIFLVGPLKKKALPLAGKVCSIPPRKGSIFFLMNHSIHLLDFRDYNSAPFFFFFTETTDITFLIITFG